MLAMNCSWIAYFGKMYHFEGSLAKLSLKLLLLDWIRFVVFILLFFTRNCLNRPCFMFVCIKRLNDFIFATIWIITVFLVEFYVFSYIFLLFCIYQNLFDFKPLTVWNIRGELCTHNMTNYDEFHELLKSVDILRIFSSDNSHYLF